VYMMCGILAINGKSSFLRPANFEYMNPISALSEELLDYTFMRELCMELLTSAYYF